MGGLKMSIIRELNQYLKNNKEFHLLHIKVSHLSKIHSTRKNQDIVRCLTILNIPMTH